MVLTNVYGAALTIRAALPALKESRGHLLLTGSIAGRRPIPGSLYSATKHAVHAMAESARQELDGTGVRVTVIAPGITDTAFFAKNPLDVPLQPTTSPALSSTRSSSRRTSTSTRSSSARLRRSLPSRAFAGTR